ncbi:unnamed protein product [Hymenolepis diminuta]|uniref:CASAMP N-terminal domain-containing protein n=1 Tax=Hymenolepis diminuta TaxID=6216 RepID=A0A564YQ66_HYMDI|nr:unnamed protein product [Hymenolepis diminuta]
MSENSPENSDLSIFSWIIGCAIPINASSVCKYLFDKNNLKPQLKSSLINCQLYAAALSHVYHSDKAKWRSFSSIYRQLQLYESEDLVDIKSLCDTLEESLGKNAFRQRTHAEFIENLMRLCMKKLAPFPLLECEIQQLAKGSLELESAINLSNLQQVDVNSPDFVKLYGRLLHAWLLAIAWITVPDLTQNLRPEGVQSDEIIQNLGLISLLSCASYYYRSKIATLLPPGSRSTLIKAPCLDTQLAALIERNEPMRRTACLKDDQSNAPRLFAILGGILEQKKVTSGRPEPPHISLITAALCALPHFVGSGEETFSNISALCSSAALFHWFTGSGWPKSTASQLAADEPRLATQKTSSSNQTALRNSVALQSLVRSSGGFAKKARPANPESIPAAVVDLTTVEQLVSSTTGDPLESIKSPEPIKDEGDLLSELACTAALAFVSSPNISSQSIKIYSKPQSSSQQRQSSETGNVSTNAFYLSKNHEVAKGAGGVSFTRIPANGTFKMASPSKNVPKSSIPRIDNNLTNKGQKSLSTSPRKGMISSTMPPAGVESSRNGKTNWSELARHQDEEKRSRSIAARPEATLMTSPTEVDGKSVSGVAALRLSLDQQRRTIEANRQRALRQGGRAAAQRNQAAFKALLHSSQKRRREGTNSEEPPSLAEEEEISQSDIPPEESVEEEGEEIVPEEVQEEEALSSSSPVAVDVEGTDMDDFSSSVPEQVEIMSNMEPGEFPIQCSSPPVMSSSPPEEDIPTPRVHRRPSPSSTSSPSIPSDELEAEEERRSISRRRNGKNSHSNHHHSRHREDYDQLTSSHHRSESRCSQCSHFTSQSKYDSLPRRRTHESHSRAYEENENDYEDYYGTLPPRRVTKPPKAARQPARSVKNYRTRGRDYFPEGPEDEEDAFVNETSSEVYWSTHIDRRRTSSNQRHRQRHLDALDSGEEFSYPATGSALPPRPHHLELNHLGKSAGTGLDALVIAELARSVTSLRSDIERLTAQQLSLRSDLREADFSRPVSSVHSSSRLHLANTPSGSTRAMWSSRTPLRYPSQNDVQEKMNLEPEIDREEEADGRVLTPSPDHVANENETAVETSSLLKEVKQANIASLAQPKSSEEVPTIPAKSISSEPEIKPAETLFISFENPSSEVNSTNNSHRLSYNR